MYKNIHTGQSVKCCSSNKFDAIPTVSFSSHDPEDRVPESLGPGARRDLDGSPGGGVPGDTPPPGLRDPLCVQRGGGRDGLPHHHQGIRGRDLRLYSRGTAPPRR